MTSGAIRQLISLGREEMPDAVGIDWFDYKPEAALKGGEAKKKPEDATNSPLAQDPPVDP
jgi:hypothetical protein